MQSSIAILRDEDRSDSLAEAALVQQARDDPALFAPLYHRYRDRIYWYLRARVATHEDAADLPQQVFLQALERLHQYRERKGTVMTSRPPLEPRVHRRRSSNSRHNHKPRVPGWT